MKSSRPTSRMVVSTALGSPPASPSESPNKLVILPLCLSKNPPAWVSHDKHELKESNITENNFEIHHCVVTCCKRLPAPLLGSGSDSGSGWPASPCCGRPTACQEEYVVLFNRIFGDFSPAGYIGQLQKRERVSGTYFTNLKILCWRIFLWFWRFECLIRPWWRKYSRIDLRKYFKASFCSM